MLGAAQTTRDAFSALAWVYLPVACVVFIVVIAALFAIAVRFPARRAGAPSTTAKSPRLEAAYAIGLAVIAVLLLWRSYAAISDQNAVASPGRGSGPELRIGIVASRWNWRFTYPGGVVQSGDGHGRPATLVVPADRPVRFALTSADVVHAFWLPELRAKYDAIPGRTYHFGIVFPAGMRIDDARCSEFCGEYHDRMVFRVDIRSRPAFDRWLTERRRATTRAAR